MTSKLKRIHVIIIGAVACVAVASGLYFLVISKAIAENKALQERYNSALQVWNTRDSVQANLEKAQNDYRATMAQYNYFLRTKMPPISFQDRAQGMIALWKEQAETLGPMLQAWPQKSGVRLASSIQVPAAPTNPNAIDPTMIRLDIGNLQVRGTFRQLLDHMRSWRNFGRLVQIDPPPSMTGPSPGMTAQYGIRVFLFTYGEPGPNVVMAGGGQSGTPAPG